MNRDGLSLLFFLIAVALVISPAHGTNNENSEKEIAINETMILNTLKNATGPLFSIVKPVYKGLYEFKLLPQWDKLNENTSKIFTILFLIFFFVLYAYVGLSKGISFVIAFLLASLIFNFSVPSASETELKNLQESAEDAYKMVIGALIGYLLFGLIVDFLFGFSMRTKEAIKVFAGLFAGLFLYEGIWSQIEHFAKYLTGWKGILTFIAFAVLFRFLNTVLSIMNMRSVVEYRRVGAKEMERWNE